MTTKHEKILAFIRSLNIGEKISVRQIAKTLFVSEGTAYRAIKEAESQGYVSTIGRVGTIRIEKKEKANIEKLTFAEVVNIVDGTVIGGRSGLHKTLHKFVIGAMELDSMMRYVEAGSLLIVGNRVQAHKKALEQGAPVLITGGFDTHEEIKMLADQLHLPIISCSYDTFTVASMINRAIDDRLIKKEIMMVEDILTPLEQTFYVYDHDDVQAWHALSEQTNHSRFPVLNTQKKVQGMVTAKDLIGKTPGTTLDKVMTKQPICVTAKTSVASAAHMMVWEGIELLPVVDAHQVLIGIVSRQDVLKALQSVQRQPQIGETFEDLITSAFEEVENEQGYFLAGDVTPQMINHLGTISYGSLTSLLTYAASKALQRLKKGNVVAENMTVYFLKPVQIDYRLQIFPRVMELSRKFGKVDVEVYHERRLAAKAMVTAQLIGRT